MKDFSEYKFAEIDETENQNIAKLEDEIKSETGKDIILIAYEPQK